MTAKELREKRAKVFARMKELRDQHHDEKREWVAEDDESWKKVNAEYDDLTRQIEAAEQSSAIDQRIAEAEAQQQAPAGDDRVGRGDFDGRQAAAGNGGDDGRPTEEDRTLAFQGWCRHQMDLDVDERHEEAAARCGLRITRKSLSLELPNTRQVKQLTAHFRSVHPDLAAEHLSQRALSGVTGTAGGFTIPEGFISNLEIAMLAFGGLRQVADILRTATGEPLSWPTANDTGNKGRRIAESGAVDTTGGTTSEPTFGSIVWHAHKYTSDAVLVPQELLEDSAFDLAAILGSMLGERISRITNEENTTGTGNGMPTGIVTASTLGVTAASATAIKTDEIIQLEHSVDPAYRQGAGYMMHDSVLLKIRLLKDGEGRYLWQTNIREGQPDALNGRSITINQDMAGSVASAAKTILFGQFTQYKIREVRGIRLYRLEERYRDNDQDGFVAFLRQDGGLLDAGTHPVKYLQQKA